MTIIVLSGVYIVLAIAQFAWHYKKTWQVMKDGTVTPFERLSDDPETRQ